MECCDKIKRIVGTIIGIIGIALTVFLYFFSLIDCRFFTKNINIGINFISLAILYIILIILLFISMFNNGDFHKSYYLSFQLIYSLLPLGLFGQYIKFKCLLILFIICIIPLLILQIMYEKILLENELNKNKGHSFASDTTFQVRFRV